MLTYERIWSTPVWRTYAFVSGIVTTILGFAGTTLSAPFLCAPILGLLAMPVLFLALVFLALGVGSIVQSRFRLATFGILLLAACACAFAIAAADFSIASVLLDFQRGRSPDVPFRLLGFALVATLTSSILAFTGVALRDPSRLGPAVFFGVVFAGPIPCSIVALVVFVRLGLPLSA